MNMVNQHPDLSLNIQEELLLEPNSKRQTILSKVIHTGFVTIFILQNIHTYQPLGYLLQRMNELASTFLFLSNSYFIHCSPSSPFKPYTFIARCVQLADVCVLIKRMRRRLISMPSCTYGTYASFCVELEGNSKYIFPKFDAITARLNVHS